MEGISVVIVTYNAEKYITLCLKSVLKSCDAIISKVIIVDNASSDNTIKLANKYFDNDSRIEIVKLHKNVGYPLACNIGALHATSEFIVFMNPDVIVDPYCFANLVSFMSRDEEIAVAQPKILHPGGYIDSAGGVMDVLGHGFHIGKFEKDYGQYDRPRDILYACFACAMVRRSIYLRLGGMDPYFFLYNEDLDFCWRCCLAGYRVVYVPWAVAYHVGQHASRRIPYHALYFGRRNRLFTVLANYELPLGVATAGLLSMLYALLVPASLIQSDRVEARVNVEVLRSIAWNLRRVMQKRELVKRVRRRGNWDLTRKGLITFKLMGLVLHLARLYRRQLNL